MATGIPGGPRGRRKQAKPQRKGECGERIVCFAAPECTHMQPSPGPYFWNLIRLTKKNYEGKSKYATLVYKGKKIGSCPKWRSVQGRSLIPP
ncbi:unnamed protein product [Tenebrio molitor]|nr:unnamed protein product [Tenebrio molitor]